MYVEHKFSSGGPGPMLATKFQLDPWTEYNLSHSWAVPFYKYVFLNINEDIFKCLFSKLKSRPNISIRRLLSFGILAPFKKMSHKELHRVLLTDLEVRYALDLMDYSPKPKKSRSKGDAKDNPDKYLAPFCLMTFTRFLRKCELYYLLSGCTIDLIHIALEDLFSKMAIELEVDNKTVRIDSMMVASYIKTLSRKELLYVSNAVHAKYLAKSGLELPEGLRHYLRADDHNLVMYHAEEKETYQKTMQRIIREAQELHEFSLANKCGNTYSHKIHKQIMDDQLIDDGKGGLRLREKDEGMSSRLIQSLYDLDATYREKNDESYRGYSANLVEALGGWGTILLSYDLEQNIYSDLQFYRDFLKNYIDLERFNGIPENLDELPTLEELKEYAQKAEAARLQLKAAQAESTDTQAPAVIANGQATPTANDAAIDQTTPAINVTTVDLAPSATAVIANDQTTPTANDAAIDQTTPAINVTTVDLAPSATANTAVDQTAQSAGDTTVDQAASVAVSDQHLANTAVNVAEHSTPGERLTMFNVPSVSQEYLEQLRKKIYSTTGANDPFPIPETDENYYSLLKQSIEDGAGIRLLAVSDAAFYSVGDAIASLKIGVIHIPTNLTGKSADPFLADFVFSINGDTLITCPGGHSPTSCTYTPHNRTCIARFDESDCANCPHFKECHPSKAKTKPVYIKRVSQMSKIRAVLQRFRSTELFSTACRFRNGIETVPSVLRRRYNVDHMAVRGHARIRIFFGFRVAAFDFRKLLIGLHRKASGKRLSLAHFSPNSSQGGDSGPQQGCPAI